MQRISTPEGGSGHVTPADASLEPIFVSVKQAAQMLGISTWSCYKLLDEQAMESRYQGRRRLVVVKSIHRYANNLPTYPTSGESA